MGYNPFTLAGKTILVTGASSGIGRSVAIECSKMGAVLYITARNEQRLNETLSMMQGQGHKMIVADLCDEDSIIALVADIDSLDEDSDYVVLMTIHSAKGLEFPNVFLCGMEEGLFPGISAICAEDQSEIEEERRLCYVAITRAKENLVISYAKRRMVHGETRYNIISRFIKECSKSARRAG